MPQRFFGVIISFCAAILLQLALPAFYSSWQINFLIIPLVMLFYFLSKTSCAWLALLCGCLIDCLYTHARLGFTGTSYLIGALILYEYRLYFFKDAYSTLAIMTYLFSCISSCIEAPLHLFFGVEVFVISIQWLAVDCFLMPLLDASCAFLLFSLPHFLYRQYHSYLRKTS
jgi:cell shape-determining protein MreD